MRRNCSRMKRVLGFAAVVLCLATVGCRRRQPPPVAPTPMPTQPSAAARPEGEPIKIGAILSVTGAASSLGDPEKKTVEMLAEQINEAGGVLGRPLEVIVQDDKSSNDPAALAATDLLENENVVAIVGPSRTPTTMAIKGIVQEAECPLVSCAAGAAITEPVADSYWTFRTPQMDVIAVAKIVDYLMAEGITKVASIYVDNPFGQSGNDQIAEQMPQAGIEVVATESFGGEDTDMTAHLTRIKAKAPEAVICWAVQGPPATVARNIKELQMDVKVIMSHGVANEKFIELAGDGAEGVMLPAGRLLVHDQIAADDPQRPLLAQYAADYEAKYGSAPNTFGGHAYDALTLVVQAIENAGEAGRAAIRDELERITDFEGTGGIFNYSAEDHSGLDEDAFVWVRIEGGEWKLVEIG